MPGEILRTCVDKAMADWTQCWWQDDLQRSLPIYMTVTALLSMVDILVTYTARFLIWKLPFVDYLNPSFQPMTLWCLVMRVHRESELRERNSLVFWKTSEFLPTPEAAILPVPPVVATHHHCRFAITTSTVLAFFLEGAPMIIMPSGQQAKAQTTSQLPR